MQTVETWSILFKRDLYQFIVDLIAKGNRIEATMVTKYNEQGEVAEALVICYYSPSKEVH